MFDLKNGTSFKEYMKNKTDEHIEIFNKTEVSNEAKNKIKSLKEKRIVLAFSEGYCKDCTISIPFIEKLVQENENIELTIYPREGNEAFLDEALGESRIPTVLVFDGNMEPLGAYVEFPEELKEKVEKSSLEEKRLIISDYRKGVYNDLIEKDLLKILK